METYLVEMCHIIYNIFLKISITKPQKYHILRLAELIVYWKNGLELFLRSLVPGLSCAMNEYLMFLLVYPLKNSSGIIDY